MLRCFRNRRFRRTKTIRRRHCRPERRLRPWTPERCPRRRKRSFRERIRLPTFRRHRLARRRLRLREAARKLFGCSLSSPTSSFFSRMPGEGIEPSQSLLYWILSPARLPISPPRLRGSSNIEPFEKRKNERLMQFYRLESLFDGRKALPAEIHRRFAGVERPGADEVEVLSVAACTHGNLGVNVLLFELVHEHLRILFKAEGPELQHPCGFRCACRFRLVLFRNGCGVAAGTDRYGR